MGRRKTDIDIAAMQTIIDNEKEKYNGRQMEYYQHCCNIYNNKFFPAKPLQPHTIYSRIHKTSELKIRFDLGHSQRGIKSLSPEHKQKLQEGRTSGIRKSRANTDPAYADKMHKDYPEHNKLVEAVLKGSLKAAIKLKCIDCCCGDKKEVSLCTSYTCPLYRFRPYQKLPKEGVS